MRNSTTTYVVRGNNKNVHGRAAVANSWSKIRIKRLRTSAAENLWHSPAGADPAPGTRTTTVFLIPSVEQYRYLRYYKRLRCMDQNASNCSGGSSVAQKNECPVQQEINSKTAVTTTKPSIADDRQYCRKDRLQPSEEHINDCDSVSTDAEAASGIDAYPDLSTTTSLEIPKTYQDQDARTPSSGPTPKPLKEAKMEEKRLTRSSSSIKLPAPEKNLKIRFACSNIPWKHLAQRRNYEKELYTQSYLGTSSTEILCRDEINMRMSGGNDTVTVPNVIIQKESAARKIWQETENSTMALSSKHQHQRSQIPEAKEKKQPPLTITSSPTQGSVSPVHAPGQDMLHRPLGDAVLKQEQLPFKKPSSSTTTSKIEFKPWFQKRKKRKMLQTMLRFYSK
jgi:hypothetical protein